MRPDHWVKNILILPGVVLALNYASFNWKQIFNVLLTFIAASLAASANYTINEYLDRAHDSNHPRKKERVSVLGQVTLNGVITQYLILYSLALLLFYLIGARSLIVCFLFLTNALAYNLPIIRLKEKKYLDIVSESLNSPLRLAWGWYSLSTLGFPPTSAIIAFWLTGIFLMSLKRYVELNEFPTLAEAKAYRQSLARYTKQQLLRLSMMAAFSASMLLGVYITRNRLEFLIILPFVIWIFTEFTIAALGGGKIIHSPETTIKSPKILVILVTLIIASFFLYIFDIPTLSNFLGQ
jgi:decaprenyl-phosphate phosphoribosyltransferase